MIWLNIHEELKNNTTTLRAISSLQTGLGLVFGRSGNLGAQKRWKTNSFRLRHDLHQKCLSQWSQPLCLDVGPCGWDHLGFCASGLPMEAPAEVWRQEETARLHQLLPPSKTIIALRWPSLHGHISYWIWRTWCPSCAVIQWLCDLSTGNSSCLGHLMALTLSSPLRVISSLDLFMRAIGMNVFPDGADKCNLGI